MAKVKADLHNHLRTSIISYDSDFNKAINLAQKRLGEKAIFGVVNFADRRYEQFVELKGYERVYVGENKNGVYVPEKKVLVVKGQEIPTKEGHLLVIGLEHEKHLKSGRSLEDALKEVKDLGAIAIADHPFGFEGIGNYLEKNKNLINDLEAIEVHNAEASFGLPFGPLPIRANKNAQKFYSNIKKDFPNLGALSTSDGHSMYELGRNWTEIEMPDIENKNNFVSSLKESIRQTNLQTQIQMKSAVFGAMSHAIELIVISKIEGLLAKVFFPHPIK